MIFFNHKFTFFCFFPAVMLATFLIEIVLALYAFIRYRLTPLGRLAVFTLALLAIFQASEYNICVYGSVRLWHIIGFIAITLLPVIGLHMIKLLAGHTRSLVLAYVVAFLFIATFMLMPGVISGAACTGNYVIFNLRPWLGTLYGWYYFGFLFWGIGEVVAGIMKKRKINGARAQVRALIWMLVGYFSFLAPMGAVYIMSPVARNAVPSIMCGFALVFAIILSFSVLQSVTQADKKN